MSSRFFGRVVGARLAGLFLLFAFSSRAQYTNGIYAEFNTSIGSYTCRLEYAIAPKACANFIGLATGQRPWLVSPTGQVKTNPFYNGTTFHRVIAGFMNQGGSPNGQGTDGPGYSFLDEFSSSLRHDRFGVLSMANSGPDLNGSQYFITVEPTPWLDDVHTIFGRLYGGSNVVYAINHVATDGNNKPVTNVAVQSITIRRIGTAAQAFNINAQSLPWITGLNLKIARLGTNLTVTFSNRLYVDNRTYFSTNLMQWTGGQSGGIITTPSPNAFLVSPDLPVRFFRMVQIQYQDSLFVPFLVMGRTITLNFSGENGTFVVSFNNTGGGSYTWTGGSAGAVLYYYWIQDPYRGRLRPLWLESFNYIMELHLDYDTATAGTFKGTAYWDYLYPSTIDSFPVSGTFTSSS